MDPTIKVIQLYKNARVPVRIYDNDAAFDLTVSLRGGKFFPESRIEYDAKEHFNPTGNIAIEPGRVQVVGTGLSIQFPHGWYGQIVGRSGLATKEGLLVVTGTIDPDYSGEIGVMVHNIEDTTVLINEGKVIAQLLVQMQYRSGELLYKRFPIMTVKRFESFPLETVQSRAACNKKRDAHGFGSSDNYEWDNDPEHEYTEQFQYLVE